jgi:hypothetical protein
MFLDDCYMYDHVYRSKILRFAYNTFMFFMDIRIVGDYYTVEH